MLPHLEAQAKGRQARDARNNQPQSLNPEIIPDSEKGDARDRAATLAGTNPRYVSDTKRLQDAIRAKANKARGKKASERPRKADGTLASGATTSGSPGRDHSDKSGKSSTAKAAAAGVDRGTVERVQASSEKFSALNFSSLRELSAPAGT